MLGDGGNRLSVVRVAPILNPTCGFARPIDARCCGRVFYETEIFNRNVFGVGSCFGTRAAGYEHSSFAYATGS